MYYVYILESEKDGKFYIGHTSNIENRIRRHNNGSVNSTKYRRPLKFLGSKVYQTKRDATKTECWLKKQKDVKAVLRFLKS